MITQTIAIFHDAYRELNAKKLFWIVLAISALVVAAFAAVGLNERGLTVLWWEFPSIFNSNIISPGTLYKVMFANLGVKYWLAWFASILALVSTASMIPEFISGGSIDLALSKPISRVRLFFTKYLAGLLFVTLQVLVFTTAAFLVIGIRGKEWELGLFWAVPITVLCYSYIFSMCVLFGLLTRSTITSLILTLLFWFMIFGVHATESSLLMFKTRRDLQVEKAAASITKLTADRDAYLTEHKTDDQPNPEWPSQSSLDDMQRKHDNVVASAASMRKWHGIFYSIKTLLPKTSETTDLLERKLISDADMEALIDNDRNQGPNSFPGEEISIRPDAVQKRMAEILRDRSTAWIIGTSVAFEAAILGFAAFIFWRRDF